MKYKEKFLDLLGIFIKGKILTDTIESSKELNGKYIKIEADGSRITIWYKNGLIHRDDGPAYLKKDTRFNTIKKWYKNGLIHRDNDAAVVTRNSSGKIIEEWHQNGELHRDGDKPAIINEEKNEKQWYQHGLLHREDDPAIDSEHTKKWCKHGLIHRDSGPAIISITKTDKYESWYQNGKLHREDGPAIKNFMVQGFWKQFIEQWWIDGNQLTKEEFNVFLFQKELNNELPQNNTPKVKKIKL